MSAHYLIERDGTIRQLVDPNMVAFHAGKSVMPRADDGRIGVNAFGIGVELFATPESGYTDAHIVLPPRSADRLLDGAIPH